VYIFEKDWEYPPHPKKQKATPKTSEVARQVIFGHVFMQHVP
jgi:hypothetical protein